MQVWVVVEIGCLECNNLSKLVGVFTSTEAAQTRRDDIAEGIRSTDRDVVIFQAIVDMGAGEPVGGSVWSPFWHDRYGVRAQ